MEIKKNPRADLEKSKSLNLLMGMVLALAILFVGFEWGETDIKVATDDGSGVVIDEEEIDATFQVEPPPPPPPPQEIPQEPDVIVEVDDEKKVDDLVIQSTDDDASQAQVATYVPPVVQKDDDEMPEDYIFLTVEQMPKFPGGETALLKWINDNMTYPQIALENGISGRISCQFTVNADGTVTDVEVTRGRDPSLDKEAIRVLKKLPKFEPGMQRGKPVRVKFQVPVTFRIQNQN